jgi:hypothetical protein
MSSLDLVTSFVSGRTFWRRYIISPAARAEVPYLEYMGADLLEVGGGFLMAWGSGGFG